MNNMINRVFLRMKYSGCNPFTNSFLQKLVARTLISFNMITILLQTYFLIRFGTSYKTISALVLDVVGYCAVWQINAKLYSIYAKKDILLSLHNKMMFKFWQIDDTTPELVNNIRKIYKLISVVSSIYFTAILASMYGFNIASPLLNENRLIHNIWLPEFVTENIVYLRIIFVVQFVVMSVSAASGLMSFDFIFLMGISNGITQLKLLKYKLLLIGTLEREAKEEYQVLIQCVNHHNMLLDFFEDIEQLSSVGVFSMLATNSVLGALLLFVFSVEENFSLLIPYVAVFICIALQFYVHCLFGQFIQTETESIAVAAYGASWENIPDNNVRMGILLIIQRSQKYAQITMGGYLILCLENFTRVARMILSFLTLLVNMRTE